MNARVDLAAMNIRGLEARAAEFVRKAEERKLVIGILGLGYVGLPLAEAFIKVGFKVFGFEVDPSKVESLKAGKTYIRHITDDRVRAMNSTGKFDLSIDAERLGEPDALLMCVPTPLNVHREPDLKYVVSTTEMIAKRLRPGQLVVLESTTYPGTSDELVIPILEKISGLKCGVDFAVAYSPEREDPGNPLFSATSIPKVVGANTDAEKKMALAIYDSFTQTVPVSDLKTAEAVKLSENIFRLVNIALANELKFVFTSMGIDPWEVVTAAKTKPFGYMPFYPGPGIGGHCIPIDPFYLSWKARAHGVATRFIDLAGDTMTALPRSVVEATADALSRKLQKPLSGAKVLLMGLAYKKNIDDCRESPALQILELFRKRGADVAFYDPHVSSIGPNHEHPDLPNMSGIAYAPAELKKFDCAVVITDHENVHYETMLENIPVVVDTRNVTEHLAERFKDRIVKA
jgi:UDP-N-acetyl-D-glucosamine dehydrogenase